MCRRLFRWLPLAGALLLLGGCWDRVEIDERGFVVGVAVDLPPSEGEDEGENAPDQTMLITYQIIKPGELAKSGGQSAGGGAANAYFNIQSVEESMPTATGAIAAKTGRSPYFEHLRLIAVSGSLARKKDVFADLLDYFLRSNEMRREIKIVIVDGKASDVLNVKPQNESYPVTYVESAITNNRRSSYILPESRIGDVHEHFMKRDSFAIQRVRVRSREMDMSGAAILDGDNNQLTGFLSGAETQGLNLIRNQISGGYIRTVLGGKSVALNIERARSRLETDVSDLHRIKFTIVIDIEGVLDKTVDRINLNDPVGLDTLESAFAAKTEESVRRTIDKLQRMKQDAAGFGPTLRRQHYRAWTSVEKDWNNYYFLHARFDVRVKTHIRRIGNIRSHKLR